MSAVIHAITIAPCCPDCGRRTINPDANNSSNAANNIVSLYPNPNNGNFTLNILSDVKQMATYQIISLTGQIVYNNEIALASGLNTIEIEKSSLPHGYYIVKVNSPNILQNIPLVIE